MTNPMLLVECRSDRSLGSFGTCELLPSNRVEDVQVESRSVSIVESGISLVGVDPLFNFSSGSNSESIMQSEKKGSDVKIGGVGERKSRRAS